MRFLHYLATAFVFCTGLAGVAQATSVGGSTDPMGPAWDRNDAGTAFAVFDTYPSFTFSNDTPDSSGGFNSALLSQSNTVGDSMTNLGAGIYTNVSTQVPGSDIYLTGNRGAAFAGSIDAPFTIKQFYLQIKRVSSTSDLSSYAPTLAGLTADSVSSVSGTGDTATSSSGNYSVTTWHWGPSLLSLSLTNPAALSLSIPTTAGNTRAIDGFAIDASSVAVPEPASISLLALLGLLGCRTRSKKGKEDIGSFGG